MQQQQDRYELLDSGGFRKLEQVGPYRLIRPSAQAVWPASLPASEWNKAVATFHRTSEGKGRWEFAPGSRPPKEWLVGWQQVNLAIRLTDFGHIGIFPEHHSEEFPKFNATGDTNVARPRLLNLFAYTGALSIQAAQAGYEVVHCDASRASVDWAKVNAKQSGGDRLKIRWIVEDVRKFVARELRRGSRYDAIVLDPPSFGRGAKAEVWKIEDHLVELLQNLKELASDNLHLLKLSSHSVGYTPVALQNLVVSLFGLPADHCESFEMLVPEKNATRLLPSGACCVYRKNN